MLSRLRSRRSAIAFDLGRAGIRAYQLQSRAGRLSRCDSLQLDLSPDGAAEEEETAARPDSSRLARLVGQGSFCGREIAVILPPADVQFQAFRLPARVLSEGDERIQAALKWEVSRETRSEPGDLEVRHWLLPPGHHQGLNVMAAAITTRQAVEWFEFFAQHHLHLRRLDVSPCAIVRAGCQVWTPAENELWGILDVGFHQASLTIVVGRTPTYIRSLSATTDQWTRQLATALDVPGAVAERLKREHGIRPVERGVGGSAGRGAVLEQLDAEALPGVFFGLLRESLDTLVQDINRCFSYVLQNFTDLNVSRLLLAGGGAHLRGFASFLDTQLGVSVSPLTSGVDQESAESTAPESSGPSCKLSAIEFSPTVAAAVGGAILDLEAA
jgi:Tfp pilus assembly PilM family ATPase